MRWRFGTSPLGCSRRAGSVHSSLSAGGVGTADPCESHPRGGDRRCLTFAVLYTSPGACFARSAGSGSSVVPGSGGARMRHHRVSGSVWVIGVADASMVVLRPCWGCAAVGVGAVVRDGACRRTPLAQSHESVLACSPGSNRRCDRRDRAGSSPASVSEARCEAIAAAIAGSRVSREPVSATFSDARCEVIAAAIAGSSNTRRIRRVRRGARRLPPRSRGRACRTGFLRGLSGRRAWPARLQALSRVSAGGSCGMRCSSSLLGLGSPCAICLPLLDRVVGKGAVRPGLGPAWVEA